MSFSPSFRSESEFHKLLLASTLQQRYASPRRPGNLANTIPLTGSLETVCVFIG